MRSFIFLSCFFLYLTQTANGWVVSKRKKLNSLRSLKETNMYVNFFTQNLDHFNPNDERTWQQRYFVNEDYANGTSRNIAFLFIGGEAEEDGLYTHYGFMAEYAQEINAICFTLEHRYYGKSRPRGDLSTDSLQFLTSQQALADSAFFIEGMNALYELPSDVQWIAIGCSYSGSLAAWLRQKYPHLVKAAMSGSGPLLAQLDFPEYYEGVAEDLKRDSDACWNAVYTGYKQVKTALSNSTRYGNFDKLFNTCDPLVDNVKNAMDVSKLFETITIGIASTAQYDNNKPLLTVQDTYVAPICEIMKDRKRGSEMARLGAVNILIQDDLNQTCLDFKYDNVLKRLQNTSWESEAANWERQWFYQTCTEFGFFQTSTKAFGNEFPLDFYIQQCIDLFGPRYNKIFLQKAVERTNNFYGGFNIDVTNVVFVHGSSDPWRILGITKTRNIASPAILIEGVAHCAIMDSIPEEVSPELEKARKEIKKLFNLWLKL